MKRSSIRLVSVSFTVQNTRCLQPLTRLVRCACAAPEQHLGLLIFTGQRPAPGVIAPLNVGSCLKLVTTGEDMGRRGLWDRGGDEVSIGPLFPAQTQFRALELSRLAGNERLSKWT